jgi:hypothetical protein
MNFHTYRIPVEVLTPITVNVIAPPAPVAAADGLVHLVYEITVLNQSPFPVRIESLETLDGDGSGAVVATLRGAALAAALRIGGGGTRFEPYRSGTLFLDVTFADAASVPRALVHRFVVPIDAPPPDAAAPAGPVPPKQVTFVGAPTPVSQQAAVVLSPPLAGAGWVAGNGCCAQITAHRGATLSINGAVHVAERFAIDFVQLTPDGRVATGPIDQLASYPYFGANIYAAADGVVVAVENALPEEVPGKLPADASIQTAGGNHVVVDIGSGRFAFYAHMQPGSVRVKPGDRVRTGQVLGLLGNSGNTDAPHLHFHVMDGPSPLLANGLPYVFGAFEGAGVVRDEDQLATNAPVAIDAASLLGPHQNQLPMNLEVVEFAEPVAAP